MQYKTKLQLATIHQWCDACNKSTEYMIQMMKDYTGCNDIAISHYLSLMYHQQLFDEINAITSIMVKIEKLEYLTNS